MTQLDKITTRYEGNKKKTVPLVNHAFAHGHPPFSSFSSFHGVRAAKPLFCWLERKFVIFAVFVNNPPLFGGTKARFTKSTVSWTPRYEYSEVLSSPSVYFDKELRSICILFLLLSCATGSVTTGKSTSSEN